MWVAATIEGYCKDPKKEVTVGHMYTCKPDWNVPELIACAAGAGLCKWACKTSPWWVCALCLVVEGAHCAAGGICTFVEECVPGDEFITLKRDVVDYEGDWGNYQKCGFIS